MERHFTKDLEHLNQRLIEMGNVTQRMIGIAIKALVDREEKILDEVFELERGIDAMQIEIDDAALKLLATQQPVAGDLRFLVTAMKLNSELERVGDQAVNIAENTQILLKEPPLKPLIDLPIMAEMARKMVNESLDAFIKHDVIMAKGVIMEDDRVDAFKDQIFRELLTYMMADPTSIPRAMALILIARNLERIGDQAVNIAEEVIYMVEGLDVRHPTKT